MHNPNDPADARLIRRAGGAVRPRVPPTDPADDTVRIKRPFAAGAGTAAPLLPWIGGGALGLLLAAALAWMLWPEPRPPHPASFRPPAAAVSPATKPPAAVAPVAGSSPGVTSPGVTSPGGRSVAEPPVAASPVAGGQAGGAAPPAAPPFVVGTATRRQILAATPTTLAVFRYAHNPNIVVLDFPTLREQGLMLDRVAALVEKAGLPRNRVVSWSELEAVIHARGDTVATYYYGHDYSAAALARFFALAQRDHRRLNPEEQRLHALLDQLGWLRPGVVAGMITLPRVGANRYVSMAADDAILTHELSHGEYFSNPAYAAYVQRFWDRELTAAQRAGVRRFLASEEYDIHVHELVVNEMQAYLMFTRNPEFFRASDVGITPAERVRLETIFLDGMPRGWLRDRLAALNAAH